MAKYGGELKMPCFFLIKYVCRIGILINLENHDFAPTKKCVHKGGTYHPILAIARFLVKYEGS